MKSEQLNGIQPYFRDPVLLMPIGAQSQEQQDALQAQCPELVAFIRRHQWGANRQEGIELLIRLLLVNHSMARLLERMIVNNELEDDAQANLLVMLGANPQIIDMLENFPDLQVYQWLLQLPAHPDWIALLTPLYDKPSEFQSLLNSYHTYAKPYDISLVQFLTLYFHGFDFQLIWNLVAVFPDLDFRSLMQTLYNSGLPSQALTLFTEEQLVQLLPLAALHPQIAQLLGWIINQGGEGLDAFTQMLELSPNFLAILAAIMRPESIGRNLHQNWKYIQGANNGTTPVLQIIMGLVNQQGTRWHNVGLPTCGSRMFQCLSYNFPKILSATQVSHALAGVPLENTSEIAMIILHLLLNHPDLYSIVFGLDAGSQQGVTIMLNTLSIEYNVLIHESKPEQAASLLKNFLLALMNPAKLKTLMTLAEKKDYQGFQDALKDGS